MTMNMLITNPATGETIQEVPIDHINSINKKAELARYTQPSWQMQSLQKRINIIMHFNDLLESEKDTLAHTLTLETGKPIQESYNEINGARYRVQYFIDHSQKILEEKQYHQQGNTSEVLSFEPLGVIANISAWNYPYLVGVNVFIPALIAGNAVLYKPSEFSTLTGLHIERLLHAAGIPSNIFSVVLGKGEEGRLLLDLPLDGYFFTGSYVTGKLIHEKVAIKRVPVGLELGGKDPLYITEEIHHIQQVAQAVTEGCFYNNGQSCCAVERIYVHEKIYDEFMMAMRHATSNLKVGDPFDESNQQGAITRPQHIAYLQAQVNDAIAKGAQLMIGGKKLNTAGNFYMPTLLENVNHQMSVMIDETFGPVKGVMKVKDDEEAIALMNDTEYGLTASVYSSHINRAKDILTKVNSGTGYINCCDRVTPYLPWSGRNRSGLGSTLSFLGMYSFCKPRAWHVATIL